jgi:DNA (cytosine-5)-methyltransferase 1
MKKLEVLDLFSGIGGFSLGLERSEGFETVAFCEIDRHCREVLKSHWPEIPIYENIEKVDGKPLRGKIKVITGGFPCVDISVAGNEKGLFDKNLFQKYLDEGFEEKEAKRRAKTRSGLWYEYHRLIKEIQPDWVIIENVDRLVKNGLEEVLNDLAEIRYDAEWAIIPASYIGAKHKRQRIWIVAYPSEQRFDGCIGQERHVQGNQKRDDQKIQSKGECELELREDGKIFSQRFIESIRGSFSSVWEPEPDMDRVVDGLSSELELIRKQAIKQLGNAVVPQIPQLIGQEILRYLALEARDKFYQEFKGEL